MAKAKVRIAGAKLFAGLLVLTAIGGSGLCYALFNGMTAKQAEVQARQDEVGDEKTQRTKIERVQAELADSQKQVRFLEKSVTDSWYVPTLLKQLEQSAEQNGLSLIAVRPQPVKRDAPKPAEENKEGKEGEAADKPKPERKPYEELDVQISVNGEFWSIMKFLKALNTFPKILSVRQVQIQPRSTTGSEGLQVLEAQMTVRAFVFRSSKPAAAETTDKGGSANVGG